MNYWKNQSKIDIPVALLVATSIWIAPRFGFETLFTVSSEGLITAVRTWLGPALTLLGMMSATTAFIFSVVERDEFKVLRVSRAEGQLWRIFSENIMWLGIAAFYCASMTFWTQTILFPALLGTFVIIMVSISVAKFVWIMRQIISVRIAHAEKRSS